MAISKLLFPVYDIIGLGTWSLSFVNIFALLAQRTAQKKRNFGLGCVYSRFFLAPLAQKW